MSVYRAMLMKPMSLTDAASEGSGSWAGSRVPANQSLGFLACGLVTHSTTPATTANRPKPAMFFQSTFGGKQYQIMALAVAAKVGCANLVSDNTAGCMPEVLSAITAAAQGTAPAYGNDEQSKKLNAVFSKVFL